MIQGQSYGWNDLLKVADEAGFTPLPIGEYDVIVAGATAKATNGGKDSIVVQFQVTSGPHQGKKIRNQFTISPENPNAVGFFFRHMAALGLPREYFAQSPTLAQVAQTLLNRPCRITVTHREWGGQTRDNVDAIMAPAPGLGTVPTPNGSPVMAPAPVPAPVSVPQVSHPGGMEAFSYQGQQDTPSPVPVPFAAPAPSPVPPASAPTAPAAPTPGPSPAGSEATTPPTQVSSVPPELPF